jgi:hypothetical protein
MRILPIAVLVSVLLGGGFVSAQDEPGQRPVPGDAAAATCVLPDETAHAVNTIGAVGSRTYRCVEVLDQNLQPRGVAWMNTRPRYTSEAMLKRIGSAARDVAAARGLDARLRFDEPTCFLPDKTEHLVETTVTVEGRTYRCVDILDRQLQSSGVAWTPVSPD